jgi:hypothetical protein
MELPLEKIKKSRVNPKLLIIGGFWKSGRTTALANLEDNLILDCEGGAEFIDAMKVSINNLHDFSDLIRALQSSKHRYRFITIDTGSKFEDVSLELAVINHQKSPIGKRWIGTPKEILNLSNGLGYSLQRNAYLDLLDWLKPYCDTLILVCHIKNSSFQKDGEEVTMVDISLTGQLKTIISAQADAIGMFYRKKNQSILSFRGGESFLVEARPEHLRGKDFVIIESDENNVLTFDWSKVFV